LVCEEHNMKTPALTCLGRGWRFSSLVLGILTFLATPADPAAGQATTILVTRDNVAPPAGPVQLAGGTDHAAHTAVAISGDGNIVAFSSYVCSIPPGFFDSDCGAGAVSGPADIFVRNLATNTTSQISVDPAIDAAMRACIRPDISGDGNVVSFIGCVSPGPGGWVGPWTGHLYNRTTHTTTNFGPDSTYFTALSHDGSYVAFTTNVTFPANAPSNGTWDVYLYNVASNTTTLVSRTAAMAGFPDGVEAGINMGTSSGEFAGPAISSDGRYVAFESSATDLNLVPGTVVGGGRHVYRWDRTTGMIQLVDRPYVTACAPNSDSGFYGLDISATGRFVVFQSWATNLRITAADMCGGVDPGGQVWVRDMNAANNWFDLASLDSTGAAAPFGACNWPHINKDNSTGGTLDGRYVCYESGAPLAPPAGAGGGASVDVYRRDRNLHAAPYVELMSINDPSFLPREGGNNLSCFGSPFGPLFTYCDISANGSAVAFHSKATNLIPVDVTGGEPDVFVRRLVPPCTPACPGGSVPEQPIGDCVLGGGGGNGGCNLATPVFAPLSCGQIICGTYGAAGGLRDTDWYSFTLPAPREVRWSVYGQADSQAFLFSPGQSGGCADLWTRAVSTSVGCTEAVVTSILPAGTHWAWAGTSSFNDVPCQTYIGTLTCTVVGRCTLPGGGCTLATSAGCASQQGTYAGAGTTCQTPANDPCSGAIPITMGQTVTGSTSFATVDSGAPTPCTGVPITAPGVWYTLVGGGNQVTLSMCAQNLYDSELIVYGGPCNALTCVTADDDSCQAGGSSQVTFCALPGRTYRILVTGWNNRTGDFSLTATDSGASCSCIPPNTSIVNTNAQGVLTNGAYFFNTTSSGPEALTPDGRYVAFTTTALTPPIPPGNTPAHNIFLKDRWTGALTRCSIGINGAEPNGDSDGASTSDDGRYVCFTSYATNLVPGTPAGVSSVFVYDRTAGTTRKVSSPYGTGYGAMGAISGDGSTVAFVSGGGIFAGVGEEVYVLNLITGAYDAASESNIAYGNGISTLPSISRDGNVVAFASTSTNMLPAGQSDTNGVPDVYYRDMAQFFTARASVGPGGAQANGASGVPSISADGRYIAFVSEATNLAGADANGHGDIYVFDRTAPSTSRASLTAGGAEPNGDCLYPSISSDGRYVSFNSSATNLVTINPDTNGLNDVYVRDRQGNTTLRASLGANNAQPNGQCGDNSWVSANGRFILFSSGANNLTPADTNPSGDIFVRDTGNGGVTNPTVWVPPHSLSLHPGATAQFTLFAEGSPTLHYLWFRNGVLLTNGGRISGVTTPVLTITNIVPADQGAYSCIVTDGCGGGPTPSVQLTLLSGCGSPDFNGDGDIGTDADIAAYFACLGGGCCPNCGSPDFNGDGDIGTDADIESFFRVLAGGPC
jgi:Tol biopolymer transport system component